MPRRIESKEIGMAAEPIRILHLSDFHFGEKTDWEMKPLLRGLVDTIRGLHTRGLDPDVVAVTGDIAFSGKEKEYGQARDWIDRGLLSALPKPFPRNHILIVPGNHDVDRSVLSETDEALHKHLLEEESQHRIGKVLTESSTLKAPLRRHSAYIKFVNNYRTAKQQLSVPWWHTRALLKLKDHHVYFAGLSSSWMSCSDGDQGRLLVGEWQVRALLDDAPPKADLRVALVHHPWTFLAWYDADVVENLVQLHSHIVLRGHLHRRGFRAISYPHNHCLELAAGCVYEKEDESKRNEYGKSFQLIEVDISGRSVFARSWMWSKEESKWVQDRLLPTADREGRVRFPLPNKRVRSSGR